MGFITLGCPYTNISPCTLLSNHTHGYYSRKIATLQVLPHNFELTTKWACRGKNATVLKARSWQTLQILQRALPDLFGGLLLIVSYSNPKLNTSHDHMIHHACPNHIKLPSKLEHQVLSYIFANTMQTTSYVLVCYRSVTHYRCARSTRGRVV